MGNELKLEGGVPSGKLKAPPNNCIPRRAKMRMNRKRRNSKDMMERMELKRDITRFLKEDQYLVTLKILNSLKALNTERPKDPAKATILVQQTSKTLAKMTMQSNRLNDDSKYILGPRAYIRTTISVIKRPRKTNSV